VGLMCHRALKRGQEGALHRGPLLRVCQVGCLLFSESEESLDGEPTEGG
jgi:hypothetical protein